MIIPTPVGCWLLPLAKQSLCYLGENELLNILRLDRLIPKWMSQGGRLHQRLCVLHHLSFLNAPLFILGFIRLWKQELFSYKTPHRGSIKSIILLFVVDPTLCLHTCPVAVFDLLRSGPKLNTRWCRPRLPRSTDLYRRSCRNKQWNRSCKGHENPCSKRCFLTIWISQKGCTLQGLPSSLRPGYQVEDGASDWWLDWRARVVSSTARGKAMFHKTTHSLLKINLHYTNAICIIRL